MHRTGGLELSLRLAAAIALAPQLAVARNFHLQPLRQGVDDADTDAVQSTGGLIDVAGELAAGMECGEDDFQGRFIAKLGMRIDRNAAAIVPYRQCAVGFQLDIDGAGETGNGFVHGVVEHFGGQVMHGRFVGAADIHGRPSPYRLQPFQHFDVAGRVVGACGRAVEQIRYRGASSARHPKSPYQVDGQA